MMIVPLADKGSLEEYFRRGHRLDGAGFVKIVSVRFNPV